MTYVLYFLGFLVAGFILASLYIRMKKSARKSRTKDWQIGDVIYLNWLECSSAFTKECQKLNLSHVTLSGWNNDNVFYNVGDKVFCEDWSSVDVNKSQKWRDYYTSCEDFMGIEPGFNKGVREGNTSKESDMIDGHPIETMSETLCQAYLKKAIAQEDYELANKLRKRMENFR